MQGREGGQRSEVTASEGRSRSPTSSPFARPRATATPSPARAASQTFTPALQISAIETAATAMIDMTEMSISPAMTTNVRPKAARPMKMYGVARSSRLARRRKKLESVQLQTPAARISTMSSASQRANASW
jgi:hypothetical protein